MNHEQSDLNHSSSKCQAPGNKIQTAASGSNECEKHLLTLNREKRRYLSKSFGNHSFYTTNPTPIINGVQLAIYMAKLPPKKQALLFVYLRETSYGKGISRRSDEYFARQAWCSGKHSQSTVHEFERLGLLSLRYRGVKRTREMKSSKVFLDERLNKLLRELFHPTGVFSLKEIEVAHNIITKKNEKKILGIKKSMILKGMRTREEVEKLQENLEISLGYGGERSKFTEVPPTSSMGYEEKHHKSEDMTKKRNFTKPYMRIINQITQVKHAIKHRIPIKQSFPQKPYFVTSPDIKFSIFYEYLAEERLHTHDNYKAEAKARNRVDRDIALLNAASREYEGFRNFKVEAISNRYDEHYEDLINDGYDPYTARAKAAELTDRETRQQRELEEHTSMLNRNKNAYRTNFNFKDTQ